MYIKIKIMVFLFQKDGSVCDQHCFTGPLESPDLYGNTGQPSLLSPGLQSPVDLCCQALYMACSLRHFALSAD